MEQHGHCDLREGPFGYILRRVQDQAERKICWACAILSAMEYMLARVNSVDNELSLQVLLYSLWANLRSRGKLKEISCWRNGYDEVPLFVLFRWVMIYGVGKASECESVNLHAGMTVAYLLDYTAIHVDNEELMKKLLSERYCLVATIRAYRDIAAYRHDDNSVYEVVARNESFIEHAVVIIGFGTTLVSKKNYWLIKNSWGKNWGDDDGCGRINRGSHAIHPSTDQRYLNPLCEVFACGAMKEKVLD